MEEWKSEVTEQTLINRLLLSVFQTSSLPNLCVSDAATIRTIQTQLSLPPHSIGKAISRVPDILQGQGNGEGSGLLPGELIVFRLYGIGRSKAPCKRS